MKNYNKKNHKFEDEKDNDLFAQLAAENEAKDRKKASEIERLGITDITNIQYGQKRPYDDSDYIWDIKTNGNASAEDILDFCKEFLRNNNQTYNDWEGSQHDWSKANIYFRGYFVLVDNGDWSFRYKVHEPFTD